MRASATSRISTAHAAHQPSQAANSNKADDTSTFALLLAGTAPKAKADSKDTSAHDNKPSDDKTAKTDTRTDNKTEAKAAPAPKPKSDSKTDTKADDTDSKADAQTDSAAATNDAPAMDVAVATPVQPQTQTQSTPPGEAEADTDAVEEAGAAKPAAAGAAPQGQDQAAPQDVKDKAEAAAPGKPVKDSKADAKPAPVKAAKADTAKPDAAKAEDIKPAVPQAEAPAPANAKPTESHMTAPVLAAQAAAPQANGPDAPSLTQHVQVTAKPAPNLPALAVEIAAKSQAGSKQFDIRLDPPELGRVEVRLSIDAAGKASAHLTADQPQTLDLLRKDSTSLTQALRDAGLDVNQDGLNFSLRQQAGDAHQNQGQGGRSAGRGAMLAASKSIDVTPTSAAYRAPADGRLDIKV